MSAVQDRPERAPERARTVEVHHLGDQRHRRDFTGMAAGLSALRDDQVDPGGGAPQRVLSGRGQGNHQDVVGEGLVEQRLHRDTAWFTRHYLVAPSSSVAGRSVAERVESMRFVRVLRRVWIPLVLLVVIGCGGLIVSRLHGVFGAETRPSYADGQVDATTPFNPKQVIYEVFGPAGTVADIGYFDVNSEPQQVDGAPLPWSLKITADSSAVVGNIVAQGDSDSIGCRIVVDGEVKAERISTGVNAFTHCLVKGA